jgi:hypothetical protein
MAMAVVAIHCVMDFHTLLSLPSRSQQGVKIHYCLVSLMWMKIGSNDITAQVPGVS